MALEYAVVYEEMKGLLEEMIAEKTKFANDPVKYYESFKAKHDVFLMTLKLELGYFEDLCKAINDANVSKFWVLVGKKNEIQYDADASYQIFETGLNDALQQCYSISVLPYEK